MEAGLYHDALALKVRLTSIATGGDRSVADFGELRERLVSDGRIRSLLPHWVLACRTPAEFWSFIQPKFPKYAERREFISKEFSTLLASLEFGAKEQDQPPADEQPSQEVKMQLQTFISHSSRDEELAEALINLLRAAIDGLSATRIRCTSVNGYRLDVGAHTDEQLRFEVLNSQTFIGLMTGVSSESAYVLFELGARWGAKLPLSPILGAGATSKALRGPLGGLNALRCDDSAQLHQLVRNLADQLHLALNSPAIYQRALDAVISVSKKLEAARSEASDVLTPPGPSETSRSRFAPGHGGTTRLVVGDVFAEEADVLVIPCSAQGTVSRVFEKQLDRFDAPYPAMMPLGEVALVSAPRLPGGVHALAYAASVSANKSDIRAIRTIGIKLGRLTLENRRLRTIAAPLLGTGAGRLNPVEAYEALTEGFENAAAGTATLVVCALKEADSLAIQNHERE